MRKESSILATLIITFALLLVFSPSSSWFVGRFLSGTNQNDVAEELATLRAENVSLRAELSVFQSTAEDIVEEDAAYTRANVYSRYPFNMKNQFLASVGTEDGIRVGAAVVFGSEEGAVALGKVRAVFDDTALVETVFDTAFQTSVRVGSVAVDALLTGGLTPRLTLIPKSAAVEEGDIVYAASADFPYGIALGTVRDIRVSANDLFQEASLAVGYDVNAVRSVYILDTQ